MEGIRKVQGDRENGLALAPSTEASWGMLEVVVVYTTTHGTIQALKTAASLARGLAARIRVLVPQIVPFPLPLCEPPVPAEFTERRFRTVIEGARIDTRVDIRVCRDRLQMVSEALDPGSLVVIARGARWWPAPEKRLARQLARLGHHVILSDHP